MTTTQRRASTSPAPAPAPAPKVLSAPPHPALTREQVCTGANLAHQKAFRAAAPSAHTSAETRAWADAALAALALASDRARTSADDVEEVIRSWIHAPTLSSAIGRLGTTVQAQVLAHLDASAPQSRLTVIGLVEARLSQRHHP